jgi:uncharacterized protein YjbI with pentapeptide repeats
MRRLLWLIPLLAAIAGAAVAATDESIPGWGRWTLAGTALTGAVSLGIAVLIGPASRRLAGERHPLTQAERQQMTATERVEAVNAARHTLIQAATGLVVIGGVVFTAQGLWYTAQSLDASRQAQHTAEQGQIADRYTKAVEQLGATKMNVRLGGIYALERLAQDSPRDHQTVYDVLAAFVREHDRKPVTEEVPSSLYPAADTQAALTVIARRNGTRDVSALDLTRSRLYGAFLDRANLRGVNLFNADLGSADLNGADLTGAKVNGTNLGSAWLVGANLTRAILQGNLKGAHLDNANLTKASLPGVDLTDADLTGAILTDADLTDANLIGTDLRRVRGITESEIRKVARVDKTTKF